jgi:hypothetical protein
LFWVRTVLEDEGNEILGMRSDLPCPADQAGGSPFKVSLVGFGHVLAQGGMSSLAITSRVRGHSAALEEDFHGGSREPDIELFMDQLVRNAVVVVVHLDVIIDVDPGTLPVRIDIGMNGKGFQNRFFEHFEQEPASTFKFLKGAVIEGFELFGDGLVELTETEEGSVSQRSQDPVLHLKHPGFDLGLILGFGHPGRDNDHPVMLCELPIGDIEVRFVTAGSCHGRLQVVGDKDLGDSAEELKGMDMGLNPGGKLLRQRGFGEGIIAGSQGSHKNLDLLDLSSLGVRDLHGLPCVVDEELFSGPVFLAEAEIQSLDPLLVVVAETAVLVAVGIGLLVLIPQKLKGHTLSLQFLIKVLHGGHLTLFLSDTGDGRIKLAFEGSLIEVSGKGPTQPRPLRSVQVILNRTSANA